MAPQESRFRTRFNAWLLRVGKTRVILAITVISTVLSVVLTGIGNFVFMPDVPIEEWLYISAIVPIIISPIVSSLVLSLLYQLAEAKTALVVMAETDPLTGAGNRRRFFNAAPEVITAAQTQGFPVSIVLIDIDHFKRINDQFGHAVGDAALVAVANMCRRQLREGDIFCRWGGEEFIVLLPTAGLAPARALAERLRNSVAEIAVEGVTDGITVSAGVATFETPDAGLERVISEADRQLYRAKDGGRNRVEPALDNVALIQRSVRLNGS